MSKALENLKSEDADAGISPSDYPMFYFAAIQVQNFKNATLALGPIGLSPVEWRVLILLREQPGRTVSDVSEVAVIERSKASRAVASMEKRGWIVRSEPSGDKRRAQLVLTEAGKDLCRKASVIMRRVYALNLRGISPEDFETLMRCLRLVRENTLMVELYAKR